VWTKAFWKAAAERGIKTAAQSLILAWPVGDGLLNVLNVDWELGAGVAGGGFLLSILTSLVSAGVGNQGPSLANEVAVNDLKGEVPPRSERMS
jgi:hypothetical protein